MVLIKVLKITQTSIHLIKEYRHKYKLQHTEDIEWKSKSKRKKKEEEEKEKEEAQKFILTCDSTAKRLWSKSCSWFLSRFLNRERVGVQGELVGFVLQGELVTITLLKLSLLLKSWMFNCIEILLTMFVEVIVEEEEKEEEEGNRKQER